MGRALRIESILNNKTQEGSLLKMASRCGSVQVNICPLQAISPVTKINRSLKTYLN
jgi:hypothetical protein